MLPALLAFEMAKKNFGAICLDSSILNFGHLKLMKLSRSFYFFKIFFIKMKNDYIELKFTFINVNPDMTYIGADYQKIQLINENANKLTTIWPPNL